MDANAFLTALLNAGGMGLVAAVLFYLHITSLKAFREELLAERNQCHTDHEKIMTALQTYNEMVISLAFRQPRQPRHRPEETK